MRLADVPQQWSVFFALVLIQGGAVQEGIDVLEHAKRTAPASYELAFDLGSAYLVNRDLTRALAAYDEALIVRPDAEQALEQAAATAEQQNELERSLSYWMRLKKLRPDDPAILLGFGRVCLKMDLLDDAEPALTKAASLKPADPAYQYTLAAAKVGKRQFDAAQSCSKLSSLRIRTMRSCTTHSESVLYLRRAPARCVRAPAGERQTAAGSVGCQLLSGARRTGSRAGGRRYRPPRRRCSRGTQSTRRRARRWVDC